MASRKKDKGQDNWWREFCSRNITVIALLTYTVVETVLYANLFQVFLPKLVANIIFIILLILSILMILDLVPKDKYTLVLSIVFLVAEVILEELHGF